MAVAAIAERYRARLAAAAGDRWRAARLAAPLLVPLLLVVVTPSLLAVLAAGLLVALALSGVPAVGRALRSRPVVSAAGWPWPPWPSRCCPGG